MAAGLAGFAGLVPMKGQSTLKEAGFTTAEAEGFVWRERNLWCGAYPGAHIPPRAGANPEAEAVEDSQVYSKCARPAC